MKIVVLDGYTLNSGDLSWSELEKLGEVSIYDRTPSELIVESAKDAQVLLTNKTPLDKDTLYQLPQLRYIGVLATGYNVVDTATAAKRNIIVTNVPTYGTASVAQMVFALLLELCHHVQRHSDSVHGGDWAKNDDFCYWNTPLIELSGKTMGIVGFGRIGQRVADIATAFGMKIIGYDTRRSDQSHRPGFEWSDLYGVFGQADVISLHCPLFPETKGIINNDSLGQMKSTAFLINTSRGPLVIEEDLADALNNGVIAGAGLDVLSVEPPMADNPLLRTRNCVITPHISWATKEARARLMGIAVANLKSFLAGNPVNIVCVN